MSHDLLVQMASYWQFERKRKAHTSRFFKIFGRKNLLLYVHDKENQKEKQYNF